MQQLLNQTPCFMIVHRVQGGKGSTADRPGKARRIQWLTSKWTGMGNACLAWAAYSAWHPMRERVWHVKANGEGEGSETLAPGSRRLMALHCQAHTNVGPCKGLLDAS